MNPIQFRVSAVYTRHMLDCCKRLKFYRLQNFRYMTSISFSSKVNMGPHATSQQYPSKSAK